MNTCLNCGKELVQEATGRRKKFCNNVCKQIVWQRSRKASQGAENGPKIEAYKEGGFYLFENGVFIEQDISSADVLEGNYARPQSDASKLATAFLKAILPPNKEDKIEISEETKEKIIKFQKSARKAFDGKKADLNAKDEVGQWDGPIKEKNESEIDYKIRVAEWKDKYGK